jgi:hypothetical protein
VDISRLDCLCEIAGSGFGLGNGAARYVIMASPALILCADGGGSKVCVVIRSSDGLEVRATAGPCNV